MTQEEIIKLAQEAGFENYAYEAVGIFERFARLVSAAEREKFTNTQEFVTLPREVVEHVLTAWTRGCPPDCKDGMTDSGGIHPWGEAALIQCPACRAVEALRTALEQPQNHAPDAVSMVPDGWKLVPVELTHEMVGAFNDASFIDGPKWSDADAADRQEVMRLFDPCYQAMLAAAPQQPQGEQEPVATVNRLGTIYLTQAGCGMQPGTRLYTHPQPKRDPLTDEQIEKICPSFDDPMRREMWKIGFKAAHNIK